MKRKSRTQGSLKQYISSHSQASRLSMEQLKRTPFTSMMIFAVIGIALALPTCLLVVLQNAYLVTDSWKQDTQISLFLTQDQTQNQTDELVATLKGHTDIATINYISPQQGLQQLEEQGGFKEILSQLPSNPLPGVIEVYPEKNLTSYQLSNLLNELKLLPGVESAKLDMQWVKRLFAIIQLAQHGVMVLIILLAAAVILIVSNTIRLAIQSRQKEIEVLKLIGATNSFVRRPFLYTGTMYGFSGGVLAWLLVFVLTISLATPVANLASLYNSQFKLQNLSIQYGVSLLILGAFLGWLGSWTVLSRYLKKF